MESGEQQPFYTKEESRGSLMNSMYKQEVQKYGKKDAFIAIGVALFFTIWSGLMAGLQPFRFFWAALPIDWQSAPFAVRQLPWTIEKFLGSAVLVFIILLIRKQGISSIGIHTKNLRKALCLVLLFSVAPLFFSVIVPGFIAPGFAYGEAFVGIGIFMLGLFIQFTMAASEDILYVGFLQTRMHGLFKSDLAATSASAALFALMHVPAWTITGMISTDALAFMGVMLIVWFAMHFVMVALFKRLSPLLQLWCSIP